MFHFLWNLRQDRDLSEIGSSSIRGEHASQKLEREVKRLEDRIETMHLVMMGMWAIMQRRLGITDEELAEVVRELDLRDGKLDGKLSPRVSRCAACARVMSERHARCIYCGADRLDLSSFESE